MMVIKLSGKAEEIVKARMAAEKYSDAEEYVSEIILRAEEYSAMKLDRLRQAIQVGLDELDAGQGVPFDIDEINREMDQELSRMD